MGGSINTVKKNIKTLTQNLKGENITANYGLVTYADDVHDKKLWNNESEFQATLDSIKAQSFSPQNWHDWVEGGLNGIQGAHKLLEGSKADIKVIVLVTDNYSHGGGSNNNRDCSLESTAALWDKDNRKSVSCF